MRRLGHVGLTVAVVCLLVGLAGCGSGGNGNGTPTGTSTVVGYVGATAVTAQNGGPPPLHLLSNLPAEPVAMALVKVQHGSDTLEVRSLQNGYFAAEVPAGAVTVTAYPPELPEGEQAQHSTSAPVNVTAVDGQVTEVDGTTTGTPPTVRPADFMPCHLGDKKVTWLSGWEEGVADHGPHADWIFLVIGTTAIDGVTAYVMADPVGVTPGVIAMQAGAPRIIANGSSILRPEADGSVTLYGVCEVVQNPDDTYETIGTMVSPPMVYPVMSLGKQYTLTSPTTTADCRTIAVDLIPNFSLADLHEPGREHDLEPCPDGPIVWTARLTGIGVPVTTPAGDFADTIVLSETNERTLGGVIEAQASQMIYARNVGIVAMDIVYVHRDVGEPSGTGRVVAWSEDRLLYARVGGVEYGTAP